MREPLGGNIWGSHVRYRLEHLHNISGTLFYKNIFSFFSLDFYFQILIASLFCLSAITTWGCCLTVGINVITKSKHAAFHACTQPGGS